MRDIYVDWFWEDISIKIEKEYGKGHPSKWKKGQIDIFIAHLLEKVVLFCSVKPKAYNNCKIHKNHHEETLISLSYYTFRRIFVTKESGGKLYTKNIFAAYFGYESFEDYMNGNYEELLLENDSADKEKKIEMVNLDKQVAWETYIELITRVTTRRLAEESGDESAALDSTHHTFKAIRESLKKNGPISDDLLQVILSVLSTIEPFTSSWHKKKIAGALENTDEQSMFRSDLVKLQDSLLSKLPDLKRFFS